MSGIFFVLGACLLWAFDTLIRYPLLRAGVAAEFIVTLEHFVLVLVFTPYFLKSIKKIMEAKVRHIFTFALVGGGGSALATLCFTQAMARANPSLVIILQKLQPLVAIALARMVLKEELGKPFFIWATVALFGAILVAHNELAMSLDFLTNADFSGKNVFPMYGIGLALLATIGWGAATVFGKKLSSDGFNETDIMAGRFVMGFLFLTPLIPGNAPKWIGYDFSVYIKIILMVGMSGLLAMYLFYHGLQRIPAKVCSIVEMCFPFFAVGVNWLILGASLDVLQLVGGGILLLSSIIIQLRHY